MVAEIEFKNSGLLSNDRNSIISETSKFEDFLKISVFHGKLDFLKRFPLEKEIFLRSSAL